MTLTPSAIARRIASEQWPQVQASHKVADGVFEYSCAGHGGIVALVEVAGTELLPPAAVQAAEEDGLLLDYVVYVSKGRTRLATSERIERSAWESWVHRAESLGAVVQRGKAWVGEEDCAWATIIVASDAIRNAWAKAMLKRILGDKAEWLAEFGGPEHARRVASEWHPKFMAALASA